MTRVRVVLVVAAGTVALYGCGGGGDDKLSKSDLDAKSGSICEDVNKKIDAVPDPADIRDPTQAAAYFAKLQKLNNDGVDKLKKLKPEDSLKDDWDTFMARVQDQADFVTRLENKARAKDPSGLRDLQRQIRNPTLKRRSRRAARKLGLTRCAKTG